MTFDGTNVWVANYASNNVTKLNGSTGARMGTFTVGTRPSAIAYDGSSIWVANSGSNNIMKLNTSTGAVSGTYAVGQVPAAMTMSGGSLWVVNRTSGNLSKINITTGATIATISGVGTFPNAIASDGRNVWVTTTNTSTVVKVSDAGTVLGTYPLTATANSIVFDQPGYSTSTSPNWDSSAYMWATHYYENVISKIRVSDGVVVSVLPTAASPNSIAFDGTNIWIGSNSVVTKIRAR
jgi:DNA-binding beta-propeller fold protein YncE